jgi:exonuclease SbcD
MKIIHFADLHLGVENYGKIDPATGLSSRLGDFLAVFDELVEYALREKVDLVLFCGDAYKTREPGQTQQREFARRINRLATGGVPVFLLVGNHDLPNAVGRATAIEIFDTLAVNNIYVAGRPGIYNVATKVGEIQIAAVPWLRRSTLLSRDESKNLNIEQINQKMQVALTQIIMEKASVLDPSLPSILAAHILVGDARVGRGSEKMMAIGNEPAVLLSNIANPTYDYVALGHIHKHQVLSESPPVVYSGSLERVDFGEEEDEKGFYVVDISSGEESRRQVSYKFIPVHARNFLTINVEVPVEETTPTFAILANIEAQREKIKNAIVRVNISLPAGMENQLHDRELQDTLKDAYYFVITRDIRRETRSRLGSHPTENLTPLDALKNWLETQNISPENRAVLLEYGGRIIEDNNGVEG